MSHVSLPSTSSSMDHKSLFESYLIQYNTLINGPSKHLATFIEKEINRLGIVPRRYDINGNAHRQTFQQYLAHNNIQSSTPTVNELIDRYQSVEGKSVFCMKNSKTLFHSIRGQAQFRKKLPQNNLYRALKARELGLFVPATRLYSGEYFEHGIERQSRVTGHIDRTYTVHFDQSGRYALTAADDCIVKVWDVNTALLRYTFRGHMSLISDMSISYCNQFMASGGADKYVRVWSLQNGACVEAFHHHSALITGLRFLPYVYKSTRFLFSIGYDCNVIFYEFNANTREFNPNPIIFNIRDTPGQRCLSSTFSPSGKFVAVGDSQGCLRLFCIEKGEISIIHRINAIPHNERLDSLEWCHDGMAFVSSSSRYHVARVWRYISGEWKYLDLEPKLPDAESLALFASTKLKYACTMICWSLDDRYVIASGSDHKLRVYDALTGEEKHRLNGHRGEAFHLRTHPLHANILISSAHDGFLLIWDIEIGQLLKKFTSDTPDGTFAISSILDVAVNADGSRIATVDDVGRISIYGLGTNDSHLVPREQFFHTDYDELDYDDRGFAQDVMSGLAPHLQRPPLMVSLEREFLDDKWQRKVPGKEKDLEAGRCAWLDRDIIPKLPEYLNEAWISKLTELGNLESAEFQRLEQNNNKTYMYYKSEQAQDAARNNMGRKPAPNRRTALPSLDAAIAAQDAARAANVMQGYRSEEDDDYSAQDASEEESEASSDTSDSDYDGGERSRREEHNENQVQNNVVTSSGRRVQRRVLAGNEDQQPSTSSGAPRQSGRKRRGGGDESATSEGEEDGDEEEEEEEEEEGGENAEAEQPKRPPKQRKRKEGFLQTFPESMQTMTVRRFPYIVQLGDSVVYCKQGHERYLELVEQASLFPVSPKMHPSSQLGAEEFCVVEDVRYTRKPYRLCMIRLAQTAANGDLTGFRFTIKLHDLENCPDFLILRAHYDMSVRLNLRDGDEIESILDGQWWTGTVTRRQAHDENYPTSHWYCLHIRWDNGEDDTISPWDCQKKSSGRRSNTEATPSDIISYGETPPVEGAWPGDGTPVSNRDSFCQRMAAGIDKLCANELVKPFSTPVNLAEFPLYSNIVDYCIDLETISERLRNKWYRRLIALQHDIRFIALAAEQFNEPDSIIVQNSRMLVEALIMFSNDREMTVEQIDVVLDNLFEIPMEQITEYKKWYKNKIDSELVQLATSMQDQEESSSQSREPGWIGDVSTAMDFVMSHSCAAQFLSAEGCMDMDVASALRENGDLHSIRQQISSLPDPQSVVDKVKELVEACQSAINDNRSRIYHSTVQLMHLTEEKLKPIITQFNQFLQTYETLSGRSLRRRQRKERQSSYNTRRANADSRHIGEGFYRELANGRIHRDSSSSGRPTRQSLRTTRSSRRAGSELESLGDEHAIDEEEMSDEDPEENNAISRNLSERRRHDDIEEENEEDTAHIDINPTNEDIPNEEEDKSSESSSSSDDSDDDEDNDNDNNDDDDNENNNNDDDDDDEDDDDDDDNDDGEDFDEDDEDEDEDESSRRRVRAGTSKRHAASSRSSRAQSYSLRAKRRRGNNSSDSEDDSSGRRKLRSGRSGRSGRSVNYSEDFEESENEVVTESVSQRGRVRKHRKFI